MPYKDGAHRSVSSGDWACGLSGEIDEERYALKLMRGDFSGVDQESRKAVDAVMEGICR